MAGFHIEHFGCRAARADGEAIGVRLRAFSESQPFASDLVVVNTCSVTAEADRAARSFIRRAHRENPTAKIVVTGCYAQRAPEELAALGGVAAVIGNSHKALAPQIIFDLALGKPQPGTFPPTFISVQSLIIGGPGQAPVWADDQFAHTFIEDAHLAPGAQTRPNLKIQEGCGNRCTFCVIPFTRGPSKSLSRASVIGQVQSFVNAGGKELVLSGINLGRWGRELSDSAGGTLAGLTRAILEETNLPRLRLSSIEPMDWNDELIALLREFGGRRLARHAHLPLQSGSDAVLRRMHRRYRPWHYAEKVESLVRAAGRDLTLGADVMVGFPGETDREFEETVAFIRALPFGYFHLFPFSPRPGTPGWALHAAMPVSKAAITERMAALRTLADEKARAHRGRFLGRELAAITLNTPLPLEAHGLTPALTENFLPVEIKGHLPANELVPLQVTGISEESILRAVVLR
jgi:threonylcarbamoyladenosine tRNA methylthiotransferase MtaB